MSHGLQQLVELVDHARRLGARGAEVLLLESEGMQVDVHRGKIGRNEPVVANEIVLRCWADGGAEGVVRADGTLFGTALVDKAMAQANAGAPDPLGGPVARLPSTTGGLGIDDKRHAQITLADRLEVIVAAERGARSGDRRVRAEGFRYADRRTRRAFANSRGITFEEWSTTYRAEGTVVVADDTAEITLDRSIESRAFASIASLPFGANLAQRAAALLGPALSVEGPTRVLLPPRVVASLVEKLGVLFTVDGLAAATSFIARAAAQAAERAPERRVMTTSSAGLGPAVYSTPPIVDARLHLLDDGTVPGSLRTCAFDDHGVTPVPLTLLREGAVDGRFLDPRSARRLETRPTGHWHGEALRPNNLILRAGTRSQNAVLAEIESPVLVLDHIEGWEGLDLETGAVSLRGSGHVTRRSHVEGPVRRLLFTGELLDVLNRVVEVTSDTDRMAHVDAPGLLVDGFTVS
jgi:PmbA protein